MSLKFGDAISLSNEATTLHKKKTLNISASLQCDKYGRGDNQKMDSFKDKSLLEDIHEVEMLGDIIIPCKVKTSNVLENIAKLRQERYEEVLNNFYKQLEEFGLEFKNNLKTACCILHHSLRENDDRIKILASSLPRMKTVHEEEILIQIWNHLKYEFSQKCFHVKAFYTSVREEENLRMSMLRDLLRETFTKLIVSRHSTAKNIQHELFLIAMKLDQAILMNRRQLANLSLCMYASIYREENKFFFQWKHLWCSWWQKTEEVAVEQFRFSVHELLVDDKFGNDDRIKKFIIDKDHVILRRISSLYFLRHIKPPHCTLKDVNSWSEDLISLSNNHGQLIENFKSLSNLGKTYLLKKFEQTLSNIKASLIARRICTEITAQTFIKNFSYLSEECEFHINKIIDEIKESHHCRGYHSYLV